MGVSRRSYAAQRWVSEVAVRKAIATGQITTLADGMIDPARGDSERGAQIDPTKQCGQHAKQMGAETAASKAQSTATIPACLTPPGWLKGRVDQPLHEWWPGKMRAPPLRARS